jgi:putative heme-binding domain-containing protein
MRPLLSLVLFLVVSLLARAAEPFEIKDGDRVLFLGDTLLEREGTYGYLETRMHEQFPDRRFTVRNLAFSADTPLGWSRASFDPAAKGLDRLKEQLALVKPTVVFLGYGMAASLQEMTDRSGDPTLNADPARYGAEPMSAARFKKELAQLMDAIDEVAALTDLVPANVDNDRASLSGTAVRGKASAAEQSAVVTTAEAAAASTKPNLRNAEGGRPTTKVRFVLLSPIRHEDLRKLKPGLPDPTEHNELLEQYSKAIEELAKERGGRFVSMREGPLDRFREENKAQPHIMPPQTDNGIHLGQWGYQEMSVHIATRLGWPVGEWTTGGAFPSSPLQAAIIRKNELFFHRWRPANSTYLFGFRKHEQGQNAKEMPMFDPLIDQAEAEIDRLKRSAPAKSAAISGANPSTTSPASVSDVPNPSAASATSVSAIPNPSATSPTNVPGIPNPSATPPTNVRAVPDPSVTPPTNVRAVPDPSATPPTTVATVPNPLATPSTTVATVPNPSATPSTPAAVPTLPKPDFTVADGYQIELWAENPLLYKPTQMNWDPQGRLWVASSALYPQIAPGGEATDTILVLEDTDRDGKADKSAVFAEGLLIPTGVVPVLAPVAAVYYRRGEGGESVQATPAPDGHRPPLQRYGCYVGQSTELLYFEDTDGDGKADTKRVLLSGFGTEDTHHIVHTLKWGPDGRLYFNQSVYIHTHMETPWGVVRLNSGGVLAWDPRTEKVEVFCKGLWNTWGHQFDKWGQSFQTDGAGSTGITWSYPGATFAAFEGSRRTMPSISPGSYPKFAGLELVYSPHFPADWQGNAITCDFRAHRIVRFGITDLAAAVDKETRGQGDKGKAPPLPPSPSPLVPPSSPSAGYVTSEQPDLVRTSDVSFRPIDVKLGPDGALYIADWSNPVINHGEVDFRDPRRDHTHGRIWRITKKDAPVVKWEPLVEKKGNDLLDKLVSENLWEKEQARRVFSFQMSTNEDESTGSLVAWTQQHESIAPALAAGYQSHEASPKFPGVGGAGYFMQQLGQSQQAEARAFIAAELGKAYARIQGGRHAADVYAQLRTLVSDPHPRVRLEALRALARIPTAESAALVLECAVGSAGAPPAGFGAPAGTTPRQAASSPQPATSAEVSSAGAPKTAGGAPALPDPFLDFAAWQSINDLAKPWTAAIASGAWKIEGREKQLEYGLNAIDPALAGATLAKLLDDGKIELTKGPWIELLGRAGGPPELAALYESLIISFASHCCPGRNMTAKRATAISEEQGARIVAALVEAARVRSTTPDGELILAGLVPTAPEKLRPGLLQLAGLWKTKDALEFLPTTATAGDAKAELRLAAIEGLRALGSPDAQRTLDSLCAPGQPFAIRRAALVALAAQKFSAATAHLAPVLRDAPNENEALATWRQLLAVQGSADKLAAKFADAAWAKEFPQPALAAAVRAAREGGKKAQALVAALTPLAGVPVTASAPADYKSLAERAKKDGDPALGEHIYRRATSGCTTCHAIGGAGGIVGPSLTSLGASAPLDYIVESMLAPNAKVKEGYNAVTLKLKDGTEATGIQARETAQEVILRNIAGQETPVPKASITGKTDVGSIMPAGLLEALADRERLNLFAFLGELGKPGPYDASKGAVARVWRLYPGGQPEKALKQDTSEFPALAYTLVDGRLAKDQLTETVQLVPNPGDTIFATAQFQVATAGKTRLNLTGVSKAWLDGQPLAVASEPNPTPELAPGVHTLAVKLDVKAFPEILRAEAEGANFLGN